MDVDSAVKISSDSGKKRKKGPHKADQDPTREIQIPAAPVDPDDFFSPAESAVVSEDGT